MFGQYFDGLMQILLRLLESNGQNISEEVFLTICAVINAMETRFRPYLEAVMPFIIQGLKNHLDYDVNSAAVGIFVFV